MEHKVLDRLAFLDLMLIKICNNKLEITVYRKPTHSGVITHFTSFVPYPFKVGLINTQLIRAYRIRSNWTVFFNLSTKSLLVLNVNLSLTLILYFLITARLPCRRNVNIRNFEQ